MFTLFALHTLLLSLFSVKWKLRGHKYYRSVVCAIISLRGLLYLTRNNEDADDLTCDIMCSYFIFDIVYVLLFKRKRVDLIIHHVVWYYGMTTLSMYRGSIMDRSWFSKCRNVSYLHETVSILNGVLNKHKTKLYVWKIACIALFNIPTTIGIMLPTIFTRGEYNTLPFVHSCMMKCIFVFALGYDVYMLKKIRQAMHRIKR